MPGSKPIGKLDLYPGDKTLVFRADDGKVVTAQAWCGPPHELPLLLGQSMPAKPTPSGSYVIWGVEPHHTTMKWPFSKIPWGARLRVDVHDETDVLWEDRPGHWTSVRRTVGQSAFGNLTAHNYVIGAERRHFKSGSLDLPSYWHLNDFGPLAVRYFADRNKNGRKDRNEPLEGSMFHTTPPNEGEDAVYRREHPGSTEDPPMTMFQSHGCIHLAPIQLQRMIARGAFIRGTSLTIHTYGEHYSR